MCASREAALMPPGCGRGIVAATGRKPRAVSPRIIHLKPSPARGELTKTSTGVLRYVRVLSRVCNFGMASSCLCLRYAFDVLPTAAVPATPRSLCMIDMF